MDAGTGLLLRSVFVGTEPRAVAIDDHIARVFVSNYADGTVSVIDELHCVE
jgi:DNA-binding beta-propeller fold protein YncE